MVLLEIILSSSWPQNTFLDLLTAIRKVTRVGESKTDINEERCETQVGSQGPFLIVSFSCCPQQTWWLSFLLIDFLIIIDDRLLGSIRLFPIIDDKISANSHH